MDFLLALLMILIAYLAGGLTVAIVIIWRAMAVDAIDMATTIDALREQLKVRKAE